MTRFNRLGAALVASCTILSAPYALAAAPKVASGDYKVEPAHTQVIFSVLHFGFTPFSGMFSQASGKLHLDTADPSKSTLTVTVPVSSVETSNSVLNNELKGDAWFDSAKYPNATFVSTKVTPIPGDRATIDGRLTMHGVTQPLTLHARFIGGGVNILDHFYTVGFEARGEIDRGAYGLRTYLPAVGAKVELRIAGAFEKTE